MTVNDPIEWTDTLDDKQLAVVRGVMVAALREVGYTVRFPGAGSERRTLAVRPSPYVPPIDPNDWHNAMNIARRAVNLGQISREAALAAIVAMSEQWWTKERQEAFLAGRRASAS